MRRDIMCKPLKSFMYVYSLVFLGLIFAAQTSIASECEDIKVRLSGSSFLCGDSPVGLCSNGIIANGILKGTKMAVYTAAAPGAGLWTEAPSVLSYSADAVFTTKRGDLYLSQLGVADTMRKVFTEINRVVGGTGHFHNASGDLFISGTLSTSDITTEFASDITGTLCLIDAIDHDNNS